MAGLPAPPPPTPPPPTPATTTFDVIPGMRAFVDSYATEPFTRWRDAKRCLKLLRILTRNASRERFTHPTLGVIRCVTVGAGTFRVIYVGNWVVYIPLDQVLNNQFVYLIHEKNTNSPSPCDAPFRQFRLVSINRDTRTYGFVERAADRTIAITLRNADRFCLQIAARGYNTLQLECDRHNFDILYVAAPGTMWVQVKQPDAGYDSE